MSHPSRKATQFSLINALQTGVKRASLLIAAAHGEQASEEEFCLCWCAGCKYRGEEFQWVRNEERWEKMLKKSSDFSIKGELSFHYTSKFNL